MAKRLRLLPVLFFAAAAAAAQPQEEPRASLHYKLSSLGSVLRWELPATAHTVRGNVGSYQGTIDAEPGPDGTWTVQSRIVVAADSMTTGNKKRDRIMREKVLETGQHPEIVFEATRVSADLARFRSGAQFSAKVNGTLTVRGKALPIQLPVDVYVFPDHVVLSGSFPIHWKEYGLHDPSFGIVRVKEPMNVAFRLRAVPQ
ncbi:MAG: YceI family protein [Thermoanaerobaculia bacterium]